MWRMQITTADHNRTKNGKSPRANEIMVFKSKVKIRYQKRAQHLNANRPRHRHQLQIVECHETP